MAANIYAVASYPTPIFNTKETPFQLPLKREQDGRMMAMESVAFPGTLFKVKHEHGLIWEIECNEYPSADPIYVDSRLLVPVVDPKEREKQMPDATHLLEALETMVGVRYFWGGNWPKGINLLNLYPEPKKIGTADMADALCRGVDCSGLLYYVAMGCTPRNTSQLIDYGIGIPIHELDAEAISKIVNPLDLVVWRGHVMIVLPGNRLIESRIGKGVTISKFVPLMKETINTLKDQRKPFYIRRWHSEMLYRS